MFDIFATILSAGVVISVVTLVVHEPLLLAAGISTILGVLFLLLPMMTSMTPVMGYLLIFTGIVGLGYGVLSTRSWLNVLHARRLQALARRQQLQAARAGENAAAPAKAAAPSAPSRRLDEDAEDDLPPRLAAEIDRDEAPRGKGKTSLARMGRRLGRGESEPEPEIETKPQGKPWRNPYDPAPAIADKTPAALPAAAPPPPAVRQLPALPASSPEAKPAKPARPLSRGAERIRRIKEEARKALPARRAKPAAAPPAVAVAPAAVAPEPPPVSHDDSSAKRARQQRDLMELNLLEIDPPQAPERRQTFRDSGDEPKGTKPFLSRMARRT